VTAPSTPWPRPHRAAARQARPSGQHIVWATSMRHADRPPPDTRFIITIWRSCTRARRRPPQPCDLPKCWSFQAQECVIIGERACTLSGSLIRSRTSGSAKARARCLGSRPLLWGTDWTRAYASSITSKQSRLPRDDRLSATSEHADGGRLRQGLIAGRPEGLEQPVWVIR